MCGQLDPPSGHSGGRAQPAGFSGLLGPLLLRGPPSPLPAHFPPAVAPGEEHLIWHSLQVVGNTDPGGQVIFGGVYF